VRLQLPPTDLLLLTAVGGASGTIARYELAETFHGAPHGIPWATFAANQTGAFALAIFLTVVADRRWRAAIAVGVLGAYTTFSSLAVETVLLLRDSRVLLGLAYLVGSIGAGIASARIGVGVGRRVAVTR
jgi:CrcB protein